RVQRARRGTAHVRPRVDDARDRAASRIPGRAWSARRSAKTGDGARATESGAAGLDRSTEGRLVPGTHVARMPWHGEAGRDRVRDRPGARQTRSTRLLV